MWLKCKMLAFFGVLSLFFLPSDLFSQSIPGSSSPSSSMKPFEVPKKAETKPVKKPAPAPLRLPSKGTVSNQTYFFPGILIYDKVKWEGADYLMNLTNQIGVYVEIIRPPQDTLSLDEQKIKGIVLPIFSHAEISPFTLAHSGEPALPYYQIKIFLYPLPEGYVAYCEARLFESVTLQRFIMEPGMAFQAITWQREGLVLASSDKIIEKIEKKVADMTNDFTEVYKLYRDHKKTQTVY